MRLSVVRSGPGAAARRYLALLVVVGLLQACGYRPLDGGGESRGTQRLYVAGVANDTFNPGIQAAVSTAIVRQLRLNTRVRLTDEAAADLTLSGRVTSYENEAITFNAQDIGRRYRVRVILSATLAGRKDGAARLTQEVTGEGFYSTGSTAADTRAAEQEAAQRAAQDAARRLVELLVEEL